MKTSAKMRQLTATAYHEAGHVLAFWNYGFEIESATIVPDKNAGIAGKVMTKNKNELAYPELEYGGLSRAEKKRFHALLVCYLAGYTAQRRHRPSSVRSHHGYYDFGYFMDVLATLHPEPMLPQVIRHLEAAAEKLVKQPQNWFVIERLAAELLKRRIMTGEEITAVIVDGFKQYDANCGSYG